VTATGRGGQWVALQVALAATVALVAAFAPRPDGATTVRLIVAVLLGGAAVAVASASSGALGRAFTVFPRPRPGASVTQRGPYRIVRHPIYAAVLALCVAAAVAGSPFGFVPAVALAIVLDRKASLEEAWLVETRPEYAAYRKSVRWKFLPGVR
jgi:protein-S-isoprenylcysteine O-methyltransferase Ste14